MYQSKVSARQGEDCTTIKCIDGHTNLKAVNCSSNHVNGICGKLIKTNVIKGTLISLKNALQLSFKH